MQSDQLVLLIIVKRSILKIHVEGVDQRNKLYLPLAIFTFFNFIYHQHQRIMHRFYSIPEM